MVQFGQHRAVSREPDVCTEGEGISAASRERWEAAIEHERRNRSRDDVDAGRGIGQRARQRIFCSPGLVGCNEGGSEIMKLDLLTSLYVFMLAAFIGFEVIRRVSPLLHTPLMSLTNALDAIAVVGAIILPVKSPPHRPILAKILAPTASSP